MADLPFLEELSDEIVLEFQSVVCLNVTGSTIATVNVEVNKVSDFCTCLLRDGCCFGPTGESFYCDSNIPIASRDEWKWSNEIDFPSVE